MTTPLQYDTVVVGSGIAGLFAALRASAHGSVALVTKAALEESNTRYAQGGIAAVLFDDDSVDLHVADTLAAGAGLNDERAVRVLCSEGPARVNDLIALGVTFDRNGQALARGLEAAHSRSRVIHAGGDATGHFVELGLVAAVCSAGVDIFEHSFLFDLVCQHGNVVGVDVGFASGERRSVTASATILATGGAGQMFRHTTNPSVATADGLAAAFRAGAAIRDAEFYQFHPTALALPGNFLVSEAVRGEGAVLRNAAGERFMEHVPGAELAPRDVVARAIAAEMALQDGQPVWLDATAMDAEFLTRRFPSIDATTRSVGLDWSQQYLPVTPAAHYWMGGIATDIDGRTTVPGLFAVGEVANTGVHGANRLASNSLLEGLVFAERATQAIAVDAPPLVLDDVVHVAAPKRGGELSRSDLQQVLWDNAGVMRDAHGLRIAEKALHVDFCEPTTQDEAEVRNLATAGRLLVLAASQRTESRGGHHRIDHPHTDATWARSLAFVQEPSC